jgi:hypothetical protein
MTDLRGGSSSLNRRTCKAHKKLLFNELVPYFEVPLKEAAEHLVVSETCLKKLCRGQNLNRWPYRKLKSLKEKRERILSSSVQTEKKQKEVECIDEEIAYTMQNGPKSSPRKKPDSGTSKPYGSDNVITENYLVHLDVHTEEKALLFSNKLYSSNWPQDHITPLGFKLNLDISGLSEYLNSK